MSASTTGGAIVCPFVATFDADSRLNVTSSTTESVTINNIDHTITAAGADLASAFDCSGWGINKLLDENQELIGGLVVSLPSSGSALKTILSTVLTQGDLETYLEGQYETAFQAAFPDYVSAKSTTAADDANGVGPTNTTVAGAKSGTGGTADAGNTTLSASLVQQLSTVSSYSFKVDISGGEGAAAMVTGLTTARLNTIFMQLPFANLTAAVDASGNPSSATGKKLPLKAGDSITFVFDINVTASTDPNTSNAVDHTPNAAAQTDAPPANADASTQSIQMDLGTRRVAFVIPQA